MAGDVQAILDPLISALRIQHVRQAYWQDVHAETILDHHAMKPLCGVDLGQVDRTAAELLVSKLAGVKVVVAYRNVYCGVPGNSFRL